MSRSRVEKRERLRRPVETTDPAGLAAYAAELRPVLGRVLALADDATLPDDQRIYSRAYARRGIMKGLHEIEARIEAAAPTVETEPSAVD